MATITEDYVSFETAKLLKDKGFCGQYYMYYVEDGKYICSDLHDIKDYAKSIIQFDYLHRTKVPAPTLQMVMKWLREVYNLCIEPYRTACGYLYTISTIPYGSCKCNPKEGGDDEASGQWTTYEGACEAAIKYCLEHLI